MILGGVLPSEGVDDLPDLSLVLGVFQLSEETLDDVKEVLSCLRLQGVAAAEDLVQVVTEVVCVSSERRAEPVDRVEGVRDALAHQGRYQLQTGNSLGRQHVDSLDLFAHLLSVNG